MDSTTYINEKKSAVSAYLSAYLKNDDVRDYSRVNRWGNDAVGRILALATRGKMLRATCVFLGNDLTSRTDNRENLLHAAAGLELCHTGLLIEDDVMDRDQIRRGGDSVHIQYQRILEKDGTKNSKRTGESLALCAGDMALFLGLQPLSYITPPEHSSELIRLFCRELTMVGIAQMQDVYGGNSAKEFSLDEILDVYAYKTGRYSIGLPLVTGAMIGGANKETIAKLWKVGTALGIAFQIRDDYLNIFGDSKKTGKPVGSDIREGKQTLYRYFLLKKTTGETREKLLALFGNPDAADADITFITDQINTLGVETDIQEIMEKQKTNISEILKTVPFQKEGKEMLQSLVDVVSNRES